MKIRSGTSMAAVMVAALVVVVAGCASQSHYYSSVVDYLYPDVSEPVESPSIPLLSLPMKVGIAFVPDSYNMRESTVWQEFATGGGHLMGAAALTENQKASLMRDVSAYFENRPFIGSIEIIPSAYLTPQGSFDNLDQIQTMYGVDVVVLLAYDQVQFTDEGSASMLYWTIVGAYVIKGEKNSTQTMMDAVVYDIDSRKMLFRAPGVSHVRGTATPVNLSEQLRLDSVEGFEKAAADLVVNLEVQLELFTEKVEERPEEYRVETKPGYRGGGNLGGNMAGAFLALLALFGGAAWLRPRL